MAFFYEDFMVFYYVLQGFMRILCFFFMRVCFFFNVFFLMGIESGLNQQHIGFDQKSEYVRRCAILCAVNWSNGLWSFHQEVRNAC